MKLSRQPFSEFKPRPQSGADVLLEAKDESEDLFEFYPERAIYKKDWESIKAIFEWSHNNELNWLEYSWLVRPVAILFPGAKAELHIDERVWEKTYEILDGYRDDWVIFPNTAATLFLLFPDRRHKLGLDGIFFGQAKEKLREFRDTNWSGFGLLAHNLSILFPSRIAELGLDKDAFNGIMDVLKKERSAKDWWTFGFMAEQLVLLFPDHKNEIHLDDEAMNGMKERLEEERVKGAWTDFCCLAMYLYVLCADSAQIASDGQIHITPKKPKLTREPRPLPERLQI